MTGRRTLDVSHLAPSAFGHRSILWWGTVGFCLIEAAAFGLALVAYFYLRSKAIEWPPNVGGPEPLGLHRRQRNSHSQWPWRATPHARRTHRIGHLRPAGFGRAAR